MFHPLLWIFLFNDTATTEIYTLSLHDALPIWVGTPATLGGGISEALITTAAGLSVAVPVILLHKRSEEHTSELQSPDHLVCRLLLEKKKRLDFL